MTEKTTPELPLTLAKDTTGGELIVQAVHPDGPWHGLNIRAVDKIAGAGITVASIDPAELMRNLGRLYAHPPVTAEPATAPSVEQIDEEIRKWYVGGQANPDSRREAAKAIHALYGTPGDAGEDRAAEFLKETYTNLCADVIGAAGLPPESTTDEALPVLRNLHAKAECYRAAQEAAEDLCRAKDRVIEREDEMRTAVRRHNEARERMDAARREHIEAYDAHAAARAAVEAETTEEGGA